jgi:pSer/pThr/pTyr-binding forkhead associated (FHA) protein
MAFQVTLTSAAGVTGGNQYTVQGRARCVLGRAPDCDIQLCGEDGYMEVSRHHCVLEVEPPMVRLRDLGSRNGTFVNQERIGQRPAWQTLEEVQSDRFKARELHDGDEIHLGGVMFQVSILETADQHDSVWAPMHVLW